MTDFEEADGRQIVPAGHAPRLEAMEMTLPGGETRLRIHEVDDPAYAWIEAENPVEAVE